MRNKLLFLLGLGWPIKILLFIDPRIQIKRILISNPAPGFPTSPSRSVLNLMRDSSSKTSKKLRKCKIQGIRILNPNFNSNQINKKLKFSTQSIAKPKMTVKTDTATQSIWKPDRDISIEEASANTVYFEYSLPDSYKQAISDIRGNASSFMDAEIEIMKAFGFSHLCLRLSSKRFI